LEEIKEWVEKSRHNAGTLSIPMKSRSLPDIDAIIKNAIKGIKGKGYNPAYGKPDRNQGHKEK
jgi:hypothetical protein